jgi:membrane associated rhomboid family serine protease
LFPIKDDNPTRTFPLLTIALIVLNVVIFLAQILLGDRFTYAFAMIPANVTHDPLGVNVVHLAPGVAITSGWPVWTTLFTSMFLHGGWMHLIGNMMFLWIFGNNIEDHLGRIRFLIFYLACGLVAAGLHLLLGWNSPIPTLGASGAIAGVLGAYITLHPHARITTLVFIIIFVTVVELPAQVVLGLWFLIQFYNLLIDTAATLGGGSQTGGVAFGAHVGGFVAGWLLIRLTGARREDQFRDYRRPRFFDDNWP